MAKQQQPQQRYFKATDGKRIAFWAAPCVFRSAKFFYHPFRLAGVHFPDGGVWFSQAHPTEREYPCRAYEITKEEHDALYSVRAAYLDADPKRKNWRRGGMFMQESWVLLDRR